MLTNQCERARDSTNQSSPPGMQRAVGYKMHCSFVSPHFVQLRSPETTSTRVGIVGA